MAKHFWENDNAAKTGPLLKREAKGKKICYHHVCANFTFLFFLEELSLYFRQKARAQIDYKGVESSEFGKHWKAWEIRALIDKDVKVCFRLSKERSDDTFRLSLTCVAAIKTDVFASTLDLEIFMWRKGLRNSCFEARNCMMLHAKPVDTSSAK